MLIPYGQSQDWPEPRTLEQAQADIAAKEQEALASLKARAAKRLGLSIADVNKYHDFQLAAFEWFVAQQPKGRLFLS